MALVDHEQRVFRQILKQCWRGLPRRAAGQIAAVVLDPRADASRFHHLKVKGTALLQALRFQQLSFRLQLLKAEAQIGFDLLHRLHDGRLRGHVVRVGVETHFLQLGRLFARQRVKLPDAFDLIAKERQPPGAVFHMGRIDLNRVTPNAEHAPLEANVVALVLKLYKAAQQLLLRNLSAHFEQHGHAGISFRRAHTVDAGNRRHDDDVPPFKQGPRRRVAHPVDLLVDRRFFVDIGVRPRHVGFRLVVVVVGYEVLDRIVGEELLHLPIELRRQRLVVGHDEGRPLQRLDDVRHSEGLARPRNTQKHVIALPLTQPFQQIGDGLRLVTSGLVVGDDFQRRTVVHRRPVNRVQSHGILGRLRQGFRVENSGH